MNILAFDTCLGACSVAVGRNIDTEEASIFAMFEAMEMGHAERLMPMIADTLAAAGLGLPQIGRIAVTNGPGSFTGTRISVAAARALALASDNRIEVVALSSLAVMAARASELLGQERHVGNGPRQPAGLSSRDLAIAVDARRGEVYVQLFRAGGNDPLSEPQLRTVAEAALLGGMGPIDFAGSGAAVVAVAACEQGREAAAHLPELLPRAEELARLAIGAAPLRAAVRPLYLRPADAKPQIGKSIARAPS